MDLGSAIAGLNWLAVISATIVAFLVGGLWYSRKLFGAAWMQEIGLSEDELQQGSMPVLFGGTLVLQFLAAAALGVFLGTGSDWLIGLQAGLLIGLFWIATSYATTYLFERRSMRLFLINAGYYVVLFGVMGTIIGAWN